jgi:hypothetical protein
MDDWKTFWEELSANAPPPPWYRRWFPWLPSMWRVKPLRLFVCVWHDCSYTAVPVLPPHSVDILVANHRRRRWWVGFQVWY